MKKEILWTILVLFGFSVLEFLVVGTVGSLSPILTALYGLSLIKRKEKLGIKTILWFQILIVPLVIVVPYLVRIFI